MCDNICTCLQKHVPTLFLKTFLKPNKVVKMFTLPCSNPFLFFHVSFVSVTNNIFSFNLLTKKFNKQFQIFFELFKSFKIILKLFNFWN
jgi:hypothetical protein